MKFTLIELFICTTVAVILVTVGFSAYFSDENVCLRETKQRHDADEKLKADPVSLAEALKACSALKRH